MAIVQIQFRRDTTTAWSASNPVLAIGEPAFDTDRGTLKLGNGVSTYLELPVTTGNESGSLDWLNLIDIPSGLVSGSDQLSGSFVNVDGDVISSDLIISGGLKISGSTEFGGTIVPKTPSVGLGTIDKPFSELYLQSGSLYIEPSNPNDLTVTLLNVSGNLEVSSGGIRLIEPGNSFIAVTGSFQYLSGSFTHEGASVRRGDTIVTGSFSVSGSTVTIGNNTLLGNTQLSGSIDIFGRSTLSGSLGISGSITSVDYITFDTTPESTSAAQGTLIWNPIDTTIDLVQNGTILQLGQEQQYNILNGSGQTIHNGMPVMFIGSDGASGNLIVAPMDGSDPNNARLFLGIATEQILDGNEGKVTTFGKVRGVDTTQWNAGDLLWISSSASGELTNIEPLEPDMAMKVAFVVNSKSNGTIHSRVNNLNTHEFIRAIEDSTMYADFTVSGSFTLNNPAVPTSISGSGTQGEIRTDSDYIYVCVATNSWKRSPLSTW